MVILTGDAQSYAVFWAIEPSATINKALISGRCADLIDIVAAIAVDDASYTLLRVVQLFDNAVTVRFLFDQ